MSTPYDYNIIANLNMNIRVSRDIVLMNEFGEEISRTPDIQYSQVMLDLSDIEDMLEAANSVADNVVLFHKSNSQKPTLSQQELNQVRPIITEALSTLVDNLSNPEFLENSVTKVNDNVSRFTFLDKTATHETTVSIMYVPNMLSATLVFPTRPGAIVNNYEVRYV